MMTKCKRSYKKQTFWEKHLKGWQNSSLTQVDYCRQNNLAIKSFGYWKRRLNDLAAEEIRFVPVAFDPPIATKPGTPLKVAVNGRYCVEVPDGFSPDTLKKVLCVMEAL
jgi:hypothetical protein